MRFDSGISDPKRFLIFFSDFKKEKLGNIKTILVDGTFRAVPRGFYQLLTIHCYVLTKSFAIAYILLSNKSENSYTLAINKCKIMLGIQPDNIILDFEVSLLKSLSNVFKSRLYGCYFHWTQNIWRKMQNCGFSEKYKSDGIFQKHFKKIFSLAFIPINCVYSAYKELKNSMVNYKINKMDEFFQYLDKYYFGYFDLNTGEYIEPRFKISFWSVNERILIDVPRTNNIVEGWHNGFNKRVYKPHPNIAYFIMCLKDVEAKEKFKIIQTQSGKITFARVDFYNELKLKSIVSSFWFFIDVDSFLEAVLSVNSWRFD